MGFGCCKVSGFRDLFMGSGLLEVIQGWCWLRVSGVEFREWFQVNASTAERPQKW